MSWKAVAVHRLAHLIPSLAVGTENTNFPVFNISGLDPSLAAMLNHSVSSYAELRWDRGAAATGGINCALFINHNIFSRACTWTLYGGDTAGATTDMLATGTPTSNADIFAAFDSSTRRHFTLRVANKYEDAGSNIRIGVFSAGFYYDLGGHPFNSGVNTQSTQAVIGKASAIGVPHITGYSEGIRSVSRTFSMVIHANALAMDRYLACQWDSVTGDQTIDGIGGGGGGNPLALVDDSNNVYYGYVTGEITQRAPYGDSVTLSISTIPHPGVN